MEMNNKIPNWEAQGVEPPETLKQQGFQAGYKPPAAYFNWFWHGVCACLKEIWEKLSGHASNKENPHNVTKEQVGLGNVNNTADTDKYVAFAQEAGEARKVQNALTIHLNGGRTENTDQCTFDASVSRSLNITPEKIGAAAAEHTHGAGDTFAAKPARFVIGTSTNGWKSIDCDYLCDGVSDDEEINAAINALKYGGGEIVLLDGTYKIASAIKISGGYVTLKGNGKGTKIVRAFDEGAIIEIPASGNNCTITGLYIDGKKETYTATNNVSVDVTGNNNSIIGNEVVDSINTGIRSRGNENIIANNVTRGNDDGIFVQWGERNIVSDNVAIGNNIGIANYGCNYASISGNVCSGNTTYAIEFNGGDNCTVTGNTCTGSERGIYISYGNNNTITGNTCTANTEEGILLYDNDNNVSGNVCSGNKLGISITYTERCTVTGNHSVCNSNCNMHMEDAENCLIAGNNLTVTDGDETVPAYALQLEGTSNANNYLVDNLVGSGTIGNGGGTNNRFGNTLVNLSDVVIADSAPASLSDGKWYLIKAEV